MTGKLRNEYADLRFLVVDDKPFIRNLITGMLVRSGAQHILRAESGEEAIELVQKAGGQCDCFISDWNMEPINGLRLLQMIRAGKVLHTAPDLCFILLTGTSNANVVNTAIALDVNAYLVKPISQVKLIDAIKRAAERTWSLKGPNYYLAVQGIETPPVIKEAASKSAPWVLLKSESVILAPRDEIPRKVVANHEGVPEDSAPREMIIKNKRRRSIGKIRLGSVLAEDIYNTDGKLALSKGSILDQKLISRLREIISEGDEKVRIWVGDPESIRKST